MLNVAVKGVAHGFDHAFAALGDKQAVKVGADAGQHRKNNRHGRADPDVLAKEFPAADIFQQADDEIGKVKRASPMTESTVTRTTWGIKKFSSMERAEIKVAAAKNADARAKSA